MRNHEPPAESVFEPLKDRVREGALLGLLLALAARLARRRRREAVLAA